MARILVLFLVLVLTACSGKKEKSAQVAYFNISGEPTTLNPITSTDAYATSVHAYIFEGLLFKDLDSDEWKPALAETYEVAKDKKSYTYKLRQGLKFHDGSELTSEDVKFSFDIIYDPKFNTAHRRPYFEGIKEVIAVDKYTVLVNLKDNYFKNFEVISTMMILPKHFYSNIENESEFNRKIIGTGPYLFAKYEKGKRITLVKNKDWWGINQEHTKMLHQIPKVILRFVGEENVYLELVKKGDLDFQAIRAEAYATKTTGNVWEEKIVKVKTENKAPKGFSFIGWNLRHPILKDKEVRKALAMLYNKPFVKQKFEYDMVYDATGPFYVQSDYANPETKAIAYDPEGALKILRAAGWSDTDQNGLLDKVIDGKKTQLSITILDPLPEFMKYLTIYKEDAKKIGVELNLKNVEWNAFLKLLEERNFEAMRLAWSGGYVDIDPKQIWHSASMEGGSNFIGYNNPKVDKLIDQVRVTFEKEKRIPMMRQIHQLIADDYPYLFFFNPRYSLYLHSKRIEKPKDTFVYGIGSEYWLVK